MEQSPAEVSIIRFSTDPCLEQSERAHGARKVNFLFHALHFIMIQTTVLIEIFGRLEFSNNHEQCYDGTNIHDILHRLYLASWSYATAFYLLLRLAK